MCFNICFTPPCSRTTLSTDVSIFRVACNCLQVCTLHYYPLHTDKHMQIIDCVETGFADTEDWHKTLDKVRPPLDGLFFLSFFFWCVFSSFFFFFLVCFLFFFFFFFFFVNCCRFFFVRQVSLVLWLITASIIFLSIGLLFPKLNQFRKSISD